jgi:hypothetical protein
VGWQWVFPATSHYIDRLTGEKRRHHLHESVMQRAFKEARLKTGIFNQTIKMTNIVCFIVQKEKAYPMNSSRSDAISAYIGPLTKNTFRSPTI